MTPNEEEPSALIALLAVALLVALLVASVFVTVYNIPDNPEPSCSSERNRK